MAAATCRRCLHDTRRFKDHDDDDDDDDDDVCPRGRSPSSCDVAHLLLVCRKYELLSRDSQWQQWARRRRTMHKTMTPTSFFHPKRCGCWARCCSGPFGCSSVSSRCSSGRSKGCCGSSPCPCPRCVAVCPSFCPMSCCCFLTYVTLSILLPPALCMFVACVSLSYWHCSTSPASSQTYKGFACRNMQALSSQALINRLLYKPAALHLHFLKMPCRNNPKKETLTYKVELI